MNSKTAAQLIELNRQFYSQRAASFDCSRQIDQPGFAATLAFIPPTPLAVLDIGCGNGRFGAFLAENHRLATYIGIDFAPALLQAAADRLRPYPQPSTFVQGDLAEPDVLTEFGLFDLVVCLSALHHIPQRERRLNLLIEMRNHLGIGGQIILGNWQFTGSARQRRKIRPWSEIGLSAADVERHDYLLTWQKGGFSYRYATLIDEAETAALAEAAGLTIMGQFFSDGREGNLNLYTIMKIGPNGG